MGPTLQPALASAGLHALRLLPVAILCPFFGGPLVPPPVRLAIAAGLGAAAYLACGAPVTSLHGADLVFAAGRELFLGCAIGVVASVPFEGARSGGRLADTLRGATLSEVHVAPIRQRETAVGDLLAQWTIVLSTWAGGDRLLVRAVLGTFEVLPVGAPFATAPTLAASLRGSSELLSCALLLAAPAAAGVLAADLALGLASRATPALGIASATQPARAGLGLFALAAAASALAGRLVAAVALSAGLVRALAGGAP